MSPSILWFFLEEHVQMRIDSTEELYECPFEFVVRRTADEENHENIIRSQRMMAAEVKYKKSMPFE